MLYRTALWIHAAGATLTPSQLTDLILGNDGISVAANPAGLQWSRLVVKRQVMIQRSE